MQYKKWKGLHGKEGVEPAEPIEINALTEPSYTISGLKPGTEYVVEVQAYNEMGKTKWTPVIEDEMLILYS